MKVDPKTILEEISASSAISKIVEALRPIGEIYLVGGVVRDAFIYQDNLEPKKLKEIDCASNLTPEVLTESLVKADFETVHINTSHNTVLVKPELDDVPIEITSFRSKDSKGEIVLGSSLEEDLALRDFSINSLAYCPFKNEIIDPYSGVLDIKSKTLRAIGKPAERFAEDPLRVLRLCRFVAELEFSVDPQTLKAASSVVGEINKISAERIRDELTKILISNKPAPSFKLMASIGLLEEILPELARTRGFHQNEFHKEDVFNHTLSVLSGIPADLELRLAALLHDISKPETLSIDENGRRHFYKHETLGSKLAEQILTKYCFPQTSIKTVKNLVRTHMRPINLSEAGLRRLLRDTAENFSKWRELKLADSLACKVNSEDTLKEMEIFDAEVRTELARPQVHQFSSLAVDGNDIIALGIKPGPKVGKLLKKLHDKVIEQPELNNKEQLIEMAKSI